MAIINRDTLYNDTVLYLPEENVLTEDQVRAINDDVVDNRIPEDDDIYYSQALCLSLKQCAVVNLSLSSVSAYGKKKEKVGQVEVEKFNRAYNPWREYIESLKTLCPLLPGGGWSPSSPSYIKINPSEPVEVNPDCCYSDDETYL